MSEYHSNILIGPVVVAALTPTNPPVTLPFIFRQVFQLKGGHERIRGIVIDAANAPTNTGVYIWPGRSQNVGNPQVILPGWARGFTFGGTFAITLYIRNNTIPTPQGTLFIQVSSEPVTAFASAINAGQVNPDIPPFLPPSFGTNPGQEESY